MNKEKNKVASSHTNSVQEFGELSADQRAAVVRMLRQEVTSFQGPLPPPEVLKEYDNALPGAAERILAMAEKQLEHRSNVEEMIVDRQTRQSAKGQILGFILALVFGGITLTVALAGYTTLAGILGTSTILGLAVIFVLHKVPNSMNRNTEEG